MSWDLAALAGLGGLGSITSLLQYNYQKRNDEYNRQLQREFAQHGITWRVQDALNAGIHPIYALGGGGASFSPVSSGARNDIGDELSRMGQNLSTAIRAQLTPEQRELQQAQLDLVRSQIKETDARAGYYDSLNLRYLMESLSRPSLNPGNNTGVSGQSTVIPQSQQRTNKLQGHINLKTPDILTNDPEKPYVVAGKQPLFGRYVYGPGENDYIYFPWTNDGVGESEIWENPWALGGLALYNLYMRYLGPDAYRGPVKQPPKEWLDKPRKLRDSRYPAYLGESYKKKRR